MGILARSFNITNLFRNSFKPLLRKDKEMKPFKSLLTAFRESNCTRMLVLTRDSNSMFIRGSEFIKKGHKPDSEEKVEQNKRSNNKRSNIKNYVIMKEGYEKFLKKNSCISYITLWKHSSLFFILRNNNS